MAVVKMTGKTQTDLDAIAEAEADQKATDEATAYLRETDWYIIRNIETGEPVPQEVTDKRAGERGKVRSIPVIEPMR